MMTIDVAVRVLATSAAALFLLGMQEARFEPVQKDLFSLGGAFVNAWADFDGDGDLDQFVGFDGTPNRLYRNQNGRFEDVAAAAGVADSRPTRAAAWGDYDGDGDPDLLVGFTPGDGSLLKIYRNDGGTFTDAADALGPTLDKGAVRQPVWVDVDGDGDLDLFVAFRDRANALFRNDGGTFVDIARDVGLADDRRTVGAVWFDYEEDGDLDLITGNMDGDRNGLFQQVDGRFTDVAATAGVVWGGRTPDEKANGTVRPCVADVNNDGLLDLLFANYGKNGLFLNRGKGRFEDVSAAWGIDIEARYDSCALADMENDGDLDLYVNGTVSGSTNYPDYLFRNTGTRFENVTPAAINSPHGDHGVQWVDFDLDGNMDLSLTGAPKESMHWLLRNTLQPPRSVRAIHLRIRDSAGRSTLAGRAMAVDASAKGARSQRATRLIDGGSGYNAQNDIPLHLVVPNAPRVTLVVRVLDQVSCGPGTRHGSRASTSTHEIDLSRRARIHDIRIPAFKGAPGCGQAPHR